MAVILWVADQSGPRRGNEEYLTARRILPDHYFVLGLIRLS